MGSAEDCSVQGLCQMTSEIFKEPAEVVRLWIHECERTLADRMVNKADLDRFTDMRVKTTKKYFADIPEVSPVPGLSSISLLKQNLLACQLISKLRSTCLLSRCGLC